METKTIIWIALSVVWVILFAINLKVYFFQRTLHKIHQYSGLPWNVLGVLMPVRYQNLNLLSMLRWAIVASLFFFNWIAAIVCLAIEFILPTILPEQDDYENIKKMRMNLKNKAELKPLDEVLSDIMGKME